MHCVVLLTQHHKLRVQLVHVTSACLMQVTSIAAAQQAEEIRSAGVQLARAILHSTDAQEASKLVPAAAAKEQAKHHAAIAIGASTAASVQRPYDQVRATSMSLCKLLVPSMVLWYAVDHCIPRGCCCTLALHAMQVQAIPARLCAEPQTVKQLTPWLKGHSVALDAGKAAAVEAEMEALVRTALAASPDTHNDSAPGLADTTEATGYAAGEAKEVAVAPAASALGATLDTALQAEKAVEQDAASGASQSGTKPSSAGPATSRRKSASGKPAWALTGQQAAAAAASEEAQLLDFAEGLDFDVFVHDMADKELDAAIAVRPVETVSRQSALGLGIFNVLWLCSLWLTSATWCGEQRRHTLWHTGIHNVSSRCRRRRRRRQASPLTTRSHGRSHLCVQ